MPKQTGFFGANEVTCNRVCASLFNVPQFLFTNTVNRTKLTAPVPPSVHHVNSHKSREKLRSLRVSGRHSQTICSIEFILSFLESLTSWEADE